MQEPLDTVIVPVHRPRAFTGNAGAVSSSGRYRNGECSCARYGASAVAVASVAWSAGAE